VVKAEKSIDSSYRVAASHIHPRYRSYPGSSPTSGGLPEAPEASVSCVVFSFQFCVYIKKNIFIINDSKVHLFNSCEIINS
jgi:hypothetical protein